MATSERESTEKITDVERLRRIVRRQERDEALRELLSHCRQMDCADDPGYGDVANRLSKILDGER